MFHVIPQSCRVGIVCVGFYLLLCLAVFAAILKQTGGHFLYTLDDPYIHLALAENLSQGHYGINSDHPASPSSSVIWPLLLIPFAGHRWHSYNPLLFNILLGGASAWIIGRVIDRWPGSFFQRGCEREVEQWKHAFIGCLLVLVANLVSLTFTGMEHVLQIFLALCCAYAVTETMAERPIPTWTLLAAVLGPSVRYENFSITLCLALLLFLLHRRKLAITLVVLAALPLVGFSLYLHSLGLPALPTSVLVKGGATDSHISLLRSVYYRMRGTIHSVVTHPDRWPMLLLCVSAGFFVLMERNRIRRFALVGVMLVTGTHLLIFPFGWFHRYEVYALIFASLILLDAMVQRPQFRYSYVSLGVLALMSLSSVYTFVASPRAASGIYGQQYQMHRFVTEFFHGRFAVNDLGLVSYQRAGDDYVVDLWGLGSHEAALQQNKNAAWLVEIAHRNKVSLAMIYPDWYESIPSSWKPIGMMCLTEKPITATEPCVTFYSTDLEQREHLEAAMRRFAETLPRQDTFTFSPLRLASR